MLKFLKFVPLSRRQKRNKTAWIFSLSVILIYSVLIDPAKSNITTCGFKELTGLDCPTCGISRSFYAFSHFNFTDAFSFHLLGPLLFTAFFIAIVIFLIELLSDKEIELSSTVISLKIFVTVFFGVWFVYWIIRIV